MEDSMGKQKRKGHNKPQSAPEPFDFSKMTVPEYRAESDILNDLEKLCASAGYAHTLAFICWRENFIGYDKNELKPDDLGKMKSFNRLIRNEISLLIGLMVKSPLSLEQPSIADYQVQMEGTERLLNELHHAMASQVWVGVKETGFDPQNDNPLKRGFALREPFFYSGEAAYLFQYRDFSPIKYAGDAEWLRKSKGFSIEDVKKTIDALAEIQLEKFQYIREQGPPQNGEDITLLPAFTFEIGAVATKSGCSQQVTSAVFDAFSIKALPCNSKLTSIGDFNETNAYPFISIGDGKFLMFQGYSLAESAYETPFFWMLQDKAYAEKAKENRGLFTESFSADRLKSVFGEGRVYENVYLFDSKIKNPKTGQEAGEIDILVTYADRAIVLQAKSKKLSEAARKGDDTAIKSDFKKAIQGAYDQGFKCANFLTDENYRILDKDGTPIDIRRDYKEIFVFCTVSEFYPALAHQSSQFLETKDHDIIQKPYVMDVFFLDVLCEMLDTPLQFFTFLHRRAGYSERVKSNSELSVLSFHLAYNLWVKDEYDFFYLEDDFAVHVDAAMLVRRDGLPGNRTPEGILTKLEGTFFDRIIKKIGELEADDVLEFGYFLLEINEQSAEDLSKACEFILEETRQDGQVHDFTMAFGDSGITVHSCPNWDDSAFNRLYAHCEGRKYSQRSTKWFGLALNPHNPDFIEIVMGLNAPWEYSDKMEAFLKTMPNVQHKNLKQALHPNQPLRKKPKIGRNEPCICGSGKKDKKCCKNSSR